MRKLYYVSTIVLLLLVFGLNGCMMFKARKFGSDYSYTGTFHKYKTFNFVTHASEQDSATTQNYEVLKKFIKERLEIQGYEFTEKKPDLLVSYYLYFNDLNMKGYEQEEFDIWLVNNEEPAKEHDPYRPVKMFMSQGTLLVTLLDHKKQNAVWQGYTSGVLADKSAENTAYLNRAVRTIFDQYRVFRKGYLRDNSLSN
ncbi:MULTISPECIES: DUF4136 domain-containing protein [Rufibacter]|uniref:DUF4136 domain-containing protein n=1 Tax=Rufibacter quisquiliarum TaxID=1549639 RepID=A0A839GRF2_9BACT|nr:MULTISPECIES: DUF4136 domain-containing protein [Rufibacter]MBA9078085.1 hypothetical protein [Rufibacter quisquiliarum]